VRRADARTGWPQLNILLNRWRKMRHAIHRWSVVWTLTGRERFDAVQARDYVGQAWIAWSVARLRRVPFVFQLDAMHYETYLCSRLAGGLRLGLWRRIWPLLSRERDRFMRRADLVFVLSEEMRRLFLGKGVRPERCFVFPVGAGDAFLGEPGDRTEARRSLGLPEAPTVAYLGNLLPPRDPRFVFEILAEIVRRRPGTRAILLSRGGADLDRLIERHGLRSAVARGGSVDYADVPRHLAAADVGLYPIRLDVPFALHSTMSPLKVAEYLATGLPVVASPVPEVVDLISASGAGIVAGEDAASFAAAAVRLLDDPEAARDMGRRGREYIRAYKSFAVLAEIVERTYLERLPS
jgi:glycosyltransferase involved in cell wall biosynthesis